jgi:hypothetical protein
MVNNIFYDISCVSEGIKMIYNEEENDINILNKHESISPSNKKYTVIRYNKNILNENIIPTYGLYRSIIVNELKQVVSFAPPKSIPSDQFIKKYPIINDDIMAEEFVEGTMINVFWDSTSELNGNWEITTRNTVGAESSFYKYKGSKTFRTMFLEALKENKLHLELLNRDLCYSFVLQHPENRIVVPFNKPQLYLVAVYLIVQNEKSILVNSFDMNYVRISEYWNQTTIKFPKKYNFDSYNELINTYASMNTEYNILGVVIKNAVNGERCKIRNPVYEQVRQLRGNQPKLQYQYLSLRKQGKVGEYLKYYPEYKSQFSLFRDQLHLFTNTLFQNYISCYIKKEKPLIEFSSQYKTHMFNLHKKYLDELRDKKLFITNTVVIGYVNDLHPSQQMFSLNYHMRKRNIDFSIAEDNDMITSVNV